MIATLHTLNSPTVRPGSLLRPAAFIMLCLFALSAPPADGVEIRVNCGGNAFLGHDGASYAADQPYAGHSWGYQGGWVHEHWNPIGGSPDSILYRSARRSDWGVSYSFDVPQDTYDVTLHLSDVINHWYDMGLQRIEAEGRVLLDELDVFEIVERCYALDARFRLPVNDGVLKLQFVPLQGAAQICAIEVATAAAIPGPPPAPEELEAIPGYGCLIVNWPHTSSDDLAGYQVERRHLPAGDWETVQPAIFLMSRFIDQDVVEGEEYVYRISALDLEGLSSHPSPPATARVRHRDESTLRDYEIIADEEDLILLNGNIETDDYIPAAFQWGDFFYWEEAGARYRGQSNLYGPKKNWKIKIDGGVLEGQDRLNLNSGYADPSLIREALAFQMTRLARSPSCRTERVNLYVNGRHRGIHTQIEQIDEHWLAVRDLPDDSPVFKCGGGLHLLLPHQYKYIYERKVGPEGNLQPIIALIETINLTPPDEFPRVISETVDLVSIFDWYAFQILAGNRDFATHNFYAIQNAETERWFLVPWDLDVTLGSSGTYLHDFDPETPVNMGTEEHPDLRGHNALIEHLLQHPQFRWMYARRMRELLQGPFAPEAWLDLAGEELATITDDVAADYHKWGWESSALQAEHAQEIATYVTQRHAYLETEIADYEPEIEFGVVLNEFLADNGSTLADEFGEYDDWIEVLNVGSQPVALEGLRLSDDLRQPRTWAFPDTMILPGAHLIVWADDDPEQGPLHATFKLGADGEELVLWSTDESGNVLIDHVVFGQQEEDISMGRVPDGCGPWVSLNPPTPGAPNGPLSGLEDLPTVANRGMRPSPALCIWPNPTLGPIQVTLRGAPEPTESAPEVGIGIYDVAGRFVGRVALRGDPPAASADLRDVLARIRPGIYWLRPQDRHLGRLAPARVVLLQDGRP
ncbi:MAG: hypothetical protein GF355_12540 [Candidatus Eisenbacteria bacterium]|nr:hypothetical protein [Candidatus Eisenbacteria bacterium]